MSRHSLALVVALLLLAADSEQAAAAHGQYHGFELWARDVDAHWTLMLLSRALNVDVAVASSATPREMAITARTRGALFREVASEFGLRVSMRGTIRTLVPADTVLADSSSPGRVRVRGRLAFHTVAGDAASALDAIAEVSGRRIESDRDLGSVTILTRRPRGAARLLNLIAGLCGLQLSERDAVVRVEAPADGALCPAAPSASRPRCSAADPLDSSCLNLDDLRLFATLRAGRQTFALVSGATRGPPVVIVRGDRVAGVDPDSPWEVWSIRVEDGAGVVTFRRGDDERALR